MDSASEDVEVHAAPARCGIACVVLRQVRATPEAPLDAPVHANSFASLNIVLQGEVRSGGERLPACFLTGPFSVPFATRVAGELRSASLVFPAWLLPTLCGEPAGRLADRVVDMDLLEAALLTRACEQLIEAERTRDCAPLWRWWETLVADAVQPALAPEILRALGVEAAAAAVGCSSRQYRRRFVQAFGLAPAAWLRITRWEQAVQDLALRDGDAASIARLAADHGYADQAHLARETRSIVTSTPARLRGALRSGEGHWSLRPVRVRIVQDAKGPRP